MNASRLTVALLVATLFVACRPPIELEVPCSVDSDLSCPTGWHCDLPTGLCVDGEGPPRVTFAELDAGAVLKGRMAISLSLLSANGVEEVALQVTGPGNVSVTLSPALTSGDGVQQGTWSATFDTWHLDDGPATLQATVGDAIGLVTTHRLETQIANGSPVLLLARPAQSEVLGKLFEVEATIDASVPVQSVTAQIQGNAFDVTNKVKWTNTDRIAGTLKATIGGDLASGAARLRIVARDVAGNEGTVDVNVVIDAGT